MSTVYGPQYAAIYDLLNSAKDYRFEARFLRSVADELLGTKGRTLQLLDAACGTGSHAIALSGLHCDVTGVDLSRDMLAYARRKARAQRRTIRFREQDLERLSMPGAQFDVVTCLFESIGYLRTMPRISRALRRMHGVLRPGGMLAVEVWHAPAMLGGFDPLRVRRARGGGLQVVRIGETRLLPAQLAEVRYEIFARKGEGAWRRFAETHVNRFFTVDEITGLVAGAGLRVQSVLSGYDRNAAPSDDAFHLVVLAQKP